MKFASKKFGKRCDNQLLLMATLKDKDNDVKTTIEDREERDNHEFVR
jgi:hypothetical protein